jgi:hypothetical protein
MNNESDFKFLENYKKRIIKDVLKNLCKNYKIYDVNDNIVDKDTLYDQLIVAKVVKRCIGVTNTNPISQCTKKVLDNYDYCKTHLSKMCFKKVEEEGANEFLIHFESNNINYKVNLESQNTDLKKKFIDDSFYLIDDKFIYDNDYKKVGYIEDSNYILTNDPFILENML